MTVSEIRELLEAHEEMCHAGSLRRISEVDCYMPLTAILEVLVDAELVTADEVTDG